MIKKKTFYKNNKNITLAETLKNAIGSKRPNEEKGPETPENAIGSKRPNAIVQNDIMHYPKMTQALPETSTETSTEIKSQSVRRKTDGQTKNYSMDFIENKLDFEYINRIVENEEMVDNIKTIILEVLNSDKKIYKIDGMEIDGVIVKSLYLKLEERHIVHAVEKYREQKTRIINVKAYIIACLYSSYTEYDLHYINVAAQHGY